MLEIQEKFAIFAAVKELESIITPITAELGRFEAFFEQTLKAETEPMDSIMSYVLDTEGKRLRPVLALLCARLFGEVNERTLRAATVVEVIHSASLIHDDVIDRAEQRRGQASVKARFGEIPAVLAGDYLLSKAVLLLSQQGDHDLLHEIVSTAASMTEGELLQVRPEIQPRHDRREAYLDIITRKTARLIRSSCVVGALSVNAPSAVIQQVADFGLSLGLVFQMRDDILDADSPETVSLAQSLLPSYTEKTLTALDTLSSSTSNSAILSSLTDLTYFCARRNS